MTLEEFREWQLYFTVEQLDPGKQFADLMAALHNGPLVRRGKKLWDSSVFRPHDRWTRAAEALRAPGGRKPGPSFEQLKAQVAAHNSARRKH